ncbi:MAG: DUF3786 domain-containing protein [Lachnospiraceae bacterium]|nr:DUF3786 domain-containing protein [Lachnospiraceae bacterium]
MKQPTVNNYEKWCQEWQERFLTLDQNILLRKLPELTIEGDYLILFYFHQKYGIHRTTGQIICMEHQKPLSTYTRLNIYTLLWYCQESACFQHNWMPFKNLKDASPFGPAFQKTILDVFSSTFSGHMQELTHAMEQLGAQKLPHSDAGYQLNAFSCIPMRFLFWDGDDEFPAQSNILFDKSATDFIHVESLVTIADEALTRIAELAGIPIKGKTFS